MKIARAILGSMAILCTAAVGASAQSNRDTTNVRGQILLPNGGVPEKAIRFELSSDDGTLHDLRYTGSNGQFILEHLSTNLGYQISVRSEESAWGETVYKFIPLYTAVVRFYLKPFVSKGNDKPESVSVGAAYQPLPKVAELHDAGIKALQDGRLVEAEKLLREAAGADQKYAAAFNDLGVVLTRSKRYPEAEEAFRNGLHADPKSAQLNLNLGVALNHQNLFDKALAPLRESLRLNPTSTEAHLQLGVAEVEVDQLGAARDNLLTAQKSLGDKATENATLQLYLGELFARTGDYQQSVSAFEMYLMVAPGSGNAPHVKSLIERMNAEIAKRRHD